MQGKGLKRQSQFHPDEHIPPSERAELHHYARSGYDRGHVAPSADMFDMQSQHECFSLANMVPQVPENNRGPWEGIESTVRMLAKRSGDLYIVTGSIFQGENLQRIGGAVMVPTKLFKSTKPRLLIAEDDQTIIQVLGSMLKMAKYEVAFAENGQKVVEMWEDGNYDLILMDIQMPKMNGFEATVAIRDKERVSGGHIPIIAMTVHAFKEDQQRCLDAGMDAYISKPIDFMECLQLIRDNLKKTNITIEIN